MSKVLPTEEIELENKQLEEKIKKYKGKLELERTEKLIAQYENEKLKEKIVRIYLMSEIVNAEQLRTIATIELAQTNSIPSTIINNTVPPEYKLEQNKSESRKGTSVRIDPAAEQPKPSSGDIKKDKNLKKNAYKNYRWIIYSQQAYNWNRKRTYATSI